MTVGTAGPPQVAALPHPAAEPRVTGYNRAEIRTTIRGLTATGAECRLVAPDLSLDFFTPATVELPVMYRPLGPATLYCRHGELRASRVLHADRKMELRDDLPDRPFGYVIGKVSALAARTANMWSYIGNGSVLTMELAPGAAQRSGGIE